jgi:reactive intermediate/imine deaminase
MTKRAIHSDAAPAAHGPYAQALRAGNTLYLSGQIGLDPATGELREGFDAQLEQVFANLAAVAEAGGASLDDAVKFTVFLTDLAHFGAVNEKMAAVLKPPYAARAAVQVAALPKGAVVELDAILVLPDAA